MNNGRLEHKGHLAVSMDRFEDGRLSGVSSPGGALTPLSSAAGSNAASASTSQANSDAEGVNGGDMKFRAKKKKKLTRNQIKEREVRRKLRHIEWLNSPKGTPHPPDTDDDA